MGNDVLVVTEHLRGQMADISYEMVGKAKELAAAWGGQALALVMGSGLSEQAGTLAADKTLYVDHPALAEFNPEAYGRVVNALVEQYQPRLIMCGNTSVGMDLAAWLSARRNLPCVAYVNQLAQENGHLVVTARIYGGKLATQCVADDGSVVVAVMSGAFPADAGRGATPATPVACPVDLSDLRVRFVKLILPEAGDVDITAAEKLVAIGRGIGGEENIGLAKELAEALGAELAASRPIVDAGWLPKTRQVGKSGLTVKPKLYFMLGISGAPEHLEGMKDAELIIAINTDPNAPIFDVAHYGATVDLFEVAEAMLDALA